MLRYFILSATVLDYENPINNFLVFCLDPDMNPDINVIHVIFVIRRVFCLSGIIKLNIANLHQIVDLAL